MVKLLGKRRSLCGCEVWVVAHHGLAEEAIIFVLRMKHSMRNS
jgi:hypothetical protein